MLINRDLKDAITRPARNTINQVALSFPYKSGNLRNIRHQVFKDKHDNKSVMSSTDQKMNDNTLSILNGIRSSSLLPIEDSESDCPLKLRNSFTGLVATNEQEHDLLNFCDIGERDFENLVCQTYLKNQKGMKHKKHYLKTLAPIKVTKRRFGQSEKEKKLVTECLKKRIMLMEQTSMQVREGEQFIELPRAIATKEGLPQKGQKSSITKFYEKKIWRGLYRGIPSRVATRLSYSGRNVSHKCNTI